MRIRPLPALVVARAIAVFLFPEVKTILFEDIVVFTYFSFLIIRI